MHQPFYKDLLTGRYHLPWVRLHSTYSYLDMASILDSYPEIKVTFNLTPSLIWQLKDISSSDNLDDEFYRLSIKSPADLSENERIFILKNFFACDKNREINPVQRYRELFVFRGNDLGEKALKDKAKTFSDKDIRDLQVLFNLAWCGFTLKGSNPAVKDLAHKGKNFTEIDKKTLMHIQRDTVKSILPLYKRLQDEGRIEVTTSPFYHPILPLLCGEKGNYDYREDAAVQIIKAIEQYKEVFGMHPRGLWPPEGAVSQEIIPVIAEHGIKWIATDEGILLESFKEDNLSRHELMYKAYTAEEQSFDVNVIFRDVNLSNDLSFKYAGMPPNKAAMEFISNLNSIRTGAETTNYGQIVPVILDGENPWPYYENGGKDFLEGVYKALSEDSAFSAVSVSEYLTKNTNRTKIKKLFAGSWIDRNFSKWIGTPQKDKAWQYLDEARNAIFSSSSVGKDVLEELYIAQGSDWFWWYDDFGSDLDLVFDELYITHLTNIYKLLEQPVPQYLLKPIH